MGKENKIPSQQIAKSLSYYYKNKESILSKQRDRYLKKVSDPKEREKINQRNRDWVKANPEKVIAKNKSVYENNKEYFKDKAYRWREKNKDQYAEYQKKYHKKYERSK